MAVSVTSVGSGEVLLLAGGGRIFADLAARFCASERSLDDLCASDYDKRIVENILSSGHLAALEFDWFVFGVSGYSRVCEVQLVRKRMASYMIKSGRMELGGRRAHRYALPESVERFACDLQVGRYPNLRLSGKDILELVSAWYDAGVSAGLREEDLRYLKPQATEFKAIIGMNAHALRDWFKIRCCRNAQAEIRDMACKMLKLARGAAPDLFRNAGPSCVELGYCPENSRQNQACRGRARTRDEALALLRASPVGEAAPSSPDAHWLVASKG